MSSSDAEHGAKQLQKFVPATTPPVPSHDEGGDVKQCQKSGSMHGDKGESLTSRRMSVASGSIVKDEEDHSIL